MIDMLSLLPQYTPDQFDSRHRLVGIDVELDVVAGWPGLLALVEDFVEAARGGTAIDTAIADEDRPELRGRAHRGTFGVNGETF